MRWMAVLMSVLVLTGCSAASREPDDLLLVQVLGVDGDGPVVFTAVSDGANEIEKAECCGDSFAQAREEIRWSGNGKELSLTGVSYLVVGAAADLEAVLLAVMEDAELGASAVVWVAEGRAADILGDCGDPASELKLLVLGGSAAPTVAQALAAVVTDGSVRLPCLGGRDGRIVERGEVVWRRK